MKTLQKVVVLLFSLTFCKAVYAIDPQTLLKSKDASKTDLYWMALNIYHEAGNQPSVGKIAVGMVVLNRLSDKENRFPKTIKGIVTQNCQFSWYCIVKDHKPKNDDMWKQSYKVAEFLLTKYKKDVMIDVVEGATHFHAIYVKPPWINTATKVVQIGDHIFYRWEKDVQKIKMRI
ncbi:cell wall hydrolase [bacterium]|nr:cell wall hydrolase [bacterium]